MYAVNVEMSLSWLHKKSKSSLRCSLYVSPHVHTYVRISVISAECDKIKKAGETLRVGMFFTVRTYYTIILHFAGLPNYYFS